MHSETKTFAADFLQEAKALLTVRGKERDQENGERSMLKTVNMFNTLTGLNLTETQGWIFMVILKIVRSQYGIFKSDDYIDGSAYMALAGESHQKIKDNRDKEEYEYNLSKEKVVRNN